MFFSHIKISSSFIICKAEEHHYLHFLNKEIKKENKELSHQDCIGSWWQKRQANLELVARPIH